MGRYIYGDFDYKFAFAEQDSSFGEVLEMLTVDTDNSVTRFINNSGEIVRLELNSPKQLAKKIQDYLKDFQEMTPEEKELWSSFKLRKDSEYWDKIMMRRFSKSLDLENRDVGGFGETLQFEVEY